MAKKKEGVSPSSLDEALKGCYGSRIIPSKTKEWLIENILDNINRTDKVTLNINSCPGIGKTAVVKSLATTPVDWNGKHYDGFEVIDIPLAQIEEMGDVLGYPVEEIKMLKDGESTWIKAVDSLIRDYMDKGWHTDGEQRTIYAPPSWVPKEERPGVLLFDDGNRASQRIMKGLMQLVQDYRTISWKIPNGWTIVFTGNPDNRLNQVTSMDSAQLTRMKFVTMVPDAKEWSVWAENNGIDRRLISYVLRYPEMMIGPNRTNPRSLAEFGRALKRFPSLDQEGMKKCLVEAYASLDEETVTSLVIFFQREMDLVLEPIDILERFEEKKVSEHLAKLKHSDPPKLDIINVMNDRLYAYMVSDGYEFKKEHIKNFQAWALDDNMPKDVGYSLCRRLIFSNMQHRREFMANNKKLMEFVSLGFKAIM